MGINNISLYRIPYRIPYHERNGVNGDRLVELESHLSMYSNEIS